MRLSDKTKSKPVNKTAALVTGAGQGYVPRFQGDIIYDVMPAIREIKLRAVLSRTCIDLSGVKVGRLTVLGLSKDVKSRWVCRCTCGRFVLRSAKAVKSGNGLSACYDCYRVELNKRSVKYL